MFNSLHFLFPKLLLLMLILPTLQNSPTTIITGPLTRIRGYTSQTIQFSNPFSHQFSFTSSLDQQPSSTSDPHFTFHPNTLHLSPIASIYMGSKSKTVLESIRSSRTENYHQILIFNDYLTVLRQNNQVEIVEYNPSTNNQEGQTHPQMFTKKYTYDITSISETNNPLKAYKYKNQAILFSSSHVYLLSNKPTYQTLVPYPNPQSNIAHIEWIPNTNLLLIAQYNSGIGIYKVEESSRRVTLIKRLDPKFFNLDYVSIENIKVIGQNRRVFVLDRMSGIHELELKIEEGKESLVEVKYGRMVVSQVGCYAMDSVEGKEFVLSCEHQSQNYLIEVQVEEEYNSDKNKNGNIAINAPSSQIPLKTIKMKPLFQPQYILSLHLTSTYYLSLSRKLINIYWSSNKLKLPQQHRFSTSLILPGLQTITLVIKQNIHYLFVISNNILTKYQLKEIGSKILFKSKEVMEKVVKAEIVGSCESFNKSLIGENHGIIREQEDNKTKVNINESDTGICMYKVEYQINIVEPNKPEKSDVSASISIIIILFVVLGILIWICIKKYTKIEEQARKMLQEFQKRNPHNNIAL